MNRLKLGAVTLILSFFFVSSITFSEEVKEDAKAQKSEERSKLTDESKNGNSENEAISTQQRTVFKRAKLKENIKANANVNLPQDI